jgi:hypothetical protein
MPVAVNSGTDMIAKMYVISPLLGAACAPSDVTLAPTLVSTLPPKVSTAMKAIGLAHHERRRVSHHLPIKGSELCCNRGLWFAADSGFGLVRAAESRVGDLRAPP